MLKDVIQYMKAMVLGLVVLFALIAIVPMMDSTFAQSTEPMSDGEGKDGEHEGKSCPFKNKTASVDLLPHL